MSSCPRPPRSPRKSTRFPPPQNSTTFPRLAAAAVSLLGLFDRLRGSLAACAVESLWPQISVSKVAVCHMSTAPDFERPLGSNLDTRPVRDGWISPSRKGKRARTDRSLRLRRRLESERAPLIRPGHRQVDETLETKAARKASFDCRLDDLRREESERQGHPGRTRGPLRPPLRTCRRRLLRETNWIALDI